LKTVKKSNFPKALKCSGCALIEFMQRNWFEADWTFYGRDYCYLAISQSDNFIVYRKRLTKWRSQT